MPLSKPPSYGCQDADIIQAELKHLNRSLGLPFREIAALDEYYPIPFGTLCSIANSGHIPKKWKALLNIHSKSYILTQERNKRLREMFNARGWDSVSQFLTAFLAGETDVPIRWK